MGSKPNKLVFWAVNLGHFVNDTFMSMRSVLLTFISSYLMPMSNRQIGLAISLGELTGALSQPFFGWIADKTGGRWLGAIGVTWTVSFVMLAMLIVAAGGGYVLMVIPLAIAALGSGAFHPVGSMYATDVDKKRASSNAAIFFLSGQIGLGIGPVLVGLLLNNAHSDLNTIFGAALGPANQGLLLERGSLSPVFVLWLLVVPAAIWMALTIPNRRAFSHASQQEKAAAQTKTQVKAAFPKKAFTILAIAVMFRSLSNPAMITFLPGLFQSKGWTPAEYGLITSTAWIAAGIAGLIFGTLANRYNQRYIIMFGLLGAVPAMFLLPVLDGGIVFLLALAAGALTGGSHSLIVVLAQDLMPGRKGLVSGSILGFIFATGAVGNLVIGELADRFGTPAAFQIVAVVTGITSFLWLFVPNTRRPAPPIPVDAAQVVPAGAD